MKNNLRNSFITLGLLLVLSGCTHISPRTEAPRPTDTKMSDGNVGAKCTTHADCVTPAIDLAKSICPHESRCINKQCAVVCPRVLDSTEDPNHPSTMVTDYFSPNVKCSTDKTCEESCVKTNYGKRCACVDGGCYHVMSE